MVSVGITVSSNGYRECQLCVTGIDHGTCQSNLIYNEIKCFIINYNLTFTSTFES